MNLCIRVEPECHEFVERLHVVNGCRVSGGRCGGCFCGFGQGRDLRILNIENRLKLGCEFYGLKPCRFFLRKRFRVSILGEFERFGCGPRLRCFRGLCGCESGGVIGTRISSLVPVRNDLFAITQTRCIGRDLFLSRFGSVVPCDIGRTGIRNGGITALGTFACFCCR